MHDVWYHTNFCIGAAFWHFWRLVQSTAWKMSCQPFFDTRPLELLMSLSSLPSSKDGYAVYPFFFTICSGVLACVLHRHTFELALLHHRSLPLMADCHYSNSWIRNPGPTLLLTAECLHKHEIKNYTHENDRI